MNWRYLQFNWGYLQIDSICRYLQLNWRYLQMIWRYLQFIWRYLQFIWRDLQIDRICRYLQMNWRYLQIIFYIGAYSFWLIHSLESILSTGGTCHFYRIAEVCTSTGLFANDVIIIGSVRADWPASFKVTSGNPRADKLGRNGFECIGRRDRERCVRATFMHGAIENYSMLHLQWWLACRGIKRSGTKSLFMIISHNSQSCMCRQ